jgi:SAM-dependent methyltransferase
MIRPIARFGDLPFLFKVLETPHNPAGIPDAYPFHLGVDEATGRLVQVSSPGLEAILRQAYLHGSMITGMMSEDGIGRDYTEDFLSLLAEHLTVPISGARILEIGCGNGYLLSRLNALGAREAIGIDPGPHVERARRQYGVDARRGFFPDVAPDGTFDLVIAYCVLEHVSDPVTLLRDAGCFLAPGGQVAVVVQDEEPYIRAGEFSLLFHEHFSYFSGRTLRRTLLAAGGRAPTIARSRFSNLLFGCSAWGDGATGAEESLSEDLALATSFPARAEALAGAWTARVAAAAREPGGAAVYVPGRAANYLVRLDSELQVGLRLIDDNPVLRGTYLPGIPIPIEGGDVLLASPPAETLIMSLSFGTRIAERLRTRLPASSRIVPLKRLLEFRS